MVTSEPRWKGPAALAAVGFVIAVIGFLVLWAVGVFSIAGTTSTEDEGSAPSAAMTVPNVVGLTWSDARQQLEALGLRVETEFVYGVGNPGLVTQERLPGTTQTLPGDRVTLTVARSVARVPNVIGRSKRAAIATMQRNGYEVLVRRVETSVTDAGRILSTLPAAGAQLPPRSTVVLRLAVSPRCDPNYTGFCVPNVSYDLNCADIGHMVHVVGDDRFGFDGDGNGWGCEAYG